MHTPMCRWCGEFEAGIFSGGSVDFCSAECADSCGEEIYAESDIEYDTDGEPIDTQGWAMIIFPGAK